ncbi:MAG: acyltransferase, partial [Allobaculum sp.]|nr:acyltransferase [Allobaculum sp.]
MRVIAILGILLCHSCYEFSSSSLHGFGKYLGMTFNFLFLVFSAFLLGFSWAKQNYPKYNAKYICKRIIRLSRSYYPYLVVLFAFLYLSQDYFHWQHLVSHFLYLPWFDKIKGFGHLWFLTMIVICYIASCILTRLPLNISRNNMIFGVISLIGLTFAYVMNAIG